MKALDVDSLHLRAYSDASFATNSDCKSQLGYIVILSDKYNVANVLHFVSHKSKRVARSVLGAETYAFADAFDFSYCAKNDLEQILNKKVPLHIITDSKSLFDVITQCSNTSERRLMIDLEAVREAYESHSISNVGFVRGPNNPADGLTKSGNCPPLIDILKTGLDNSIVEQWVIRREATNSNDVVQSSEQKIHECGRHHYKEGTRND